MTTISDAKTLNEKKINLWNYFLLIWIPFKFLVELIDKLFLCIFKIIFKKIRTFYLKVNLSIRKTCSIFLSKYCKNIFILYSFSD
jgi:hypothetical protein